MRYLLFPAYAGVILSGRTPRARLQPFPRIRGGDPYGILADAVGDYFSPHTRGVILRLMLWAVRKGAFPRIRGAYKKEPRAQRKVK